MSQDKGYYANQPPQYPQQAQPGYGQAPYGQAASYSPAGYPPQQQYGAPQPGYAQPGYPPSPGQGGYYAQPSPQPVIIQQQAPPQQNNKDDMCYGCALGACLCCCLEGCC